MSDPAPEPQPSTTTPTLSDLLWDKLAASAVPLTAKELAKDLPRPKKVKAPEFEQSLPNYLAGDLQSGRVFKYGSGKGGAGRYWSRDEKHVIQESVLNAATEPKKLGDLKKLAKETTKADKAFADSAVDEMVSAKQLHEHPGKGPPFARHEAVSPNNREKVSEAILTAADKPAKLAELVKVAQKATSADKKFVEEVANELVTAEQLHKQGSAKTAPYGRLKPKPLHPLETGIGKKEFDKLAKSADKLLAVVAGVTVDELLTRLRSFLANEKPKLETELKRTATATTLIAGTDGTHHSQSVPIAITPDRIRVGLKTAYDDLCLDPEFEDKLVEIRRLYHDVVRIFPSLTVPQFHTELLHLQSQRVIELQPINEVQRAKEQELAIHQNDRLLYYVIWK